MTKKIDIPIIVGSILAAIAVGLAWEVDGRPSVAYGIFIAYTIFMVKARKGFGDPAVISLFTFILYGYLPLFDLDTATTNDFGYDANGALYIYSTASVAMIVATGVAFLIFPSPDTASGPPIKTTSFHVEMMIAGTLSIFLSMIFIAEHGIFLIGGSGNYLDRFMDLSVPGAGILFLSYPLATAMLCFAIASYDRLTPKYAICLIPFLLLFLSLGQRKFLLIPFLLLSFRFMRIRTVLQLTIILAMAIAGFFLFNYVGFLREADVAFADAFDAKVIARYMDDFTVSDGEVYILYMTAASAYAHAVDGSIFNNYIAPFQLLLPQFVTGTTYLSIEEQFATLVNPDMADSKGGMGYSFYGEAFVIGGVLGIFLATAAMTLFIRSIFFLGRGLRFSGIWGVVSLSLTYQAMWYFRQGFGLYLHEVTYQITIIFGIHAIVRIGRLRARSWDRANAA